MFEYNPNHLNNAVEEARRQADIARQQHDANEAQRRRDIAAREFAEKAAAERAQLQAWWNNLNHHH